MNAVNSNFSIKLCFVIALMFLMFCSGCKNAETKVNAFPIPTASPTPESSKSNNDKIKWIPGSYAGIEIGKSNREDVVKKFGKPIWEGEEELEGEEEDVQKEIEKHGGKRTLLEFKDVGGLDGQISVYIGEQDKIVQEIVHYPKQAFSKEQLLEKYGNVYIELYGSETICSALESKQKTSKAGTNETPELLVFPGTGMYASPDKQGNIDRIGFSLVCD